MGKPPKIIGGHAIVQIGNQLGVVKMGSYQDWLEAVFDEMNELYTMELGEAVRNVNRRLRGEE